MRRAINLLRASLHYRRDAFDDGLKAAGFQITPDIRDIGAGDLMIVWNRYGGFAEFADYFERRGGAVLVAENCPMGNGWRPGRWFSLARSKPALVGGTWEDGGPSRWESWGVDLAPWRGDNGETVIFEQRGIGGAEWRSPFGWDAKAKAKCGGRVRKHPGTGPAMPLADDLRNARCAVTWTSAAAVQALALGVPIFHDFPGFAMAEACKPMARFESGPLREDASRLRVFERLAWAMWELEEVRTGEPIRRLLAEVTA